MTKKRFLAALVALLMLIALLPTAALAYSIDAFCQDSECLVKGCTGPGDPKHKDPTKQAKNIGSASLNLSSLGAYQSIDIPGKPGMTLNGVPFIPNVGYLGTVLISANDLMAVLYAQQLLSLDPDLTENDLLIKDGKLYVKGNYIFGSDYTLPNGFQRKKDVFTLEGETFELGLNGWPLTSLSCANVWPDKQLAPEPIGKKSADPACICPGGEVDPTCPAHRVTP